jgi:drug/metabolite transporter (DMT)-like permease
MLFEFILNHNVPLITGCGICFPVAGLYFRTGGDGVQNRESLVYADGFQGASIATLVFVAVMIFGIDDVRAIRALKEQASTVALFSILGSIQFFYNFVGVCEHDRHQHSAERWAPS